MTAHPKWLALNAEYWITRSEAARLLWETRRDKRARFHLPLFTRTLCDTTELTCSGPVGSSVGPA